MIEAKENLIRSDRRIVAVSKWKNQSSVYHLKGIYSKNRTGYEKGYRNFFNELANTLTVAQAADCLNWKLSSSNYLTLQIYPSSEFYFSISDSRDERENIFRAVIRRAMTRLIREISLPLNWVAAVNASSPFMVGTVVISKVIFDDKTRKSKVVKHYFPRSFFERNEPTAENVNHIESAIAESFFECAALTEDFESRIDRLIEISRRYNFKLPVRYYAFRYLDGAGNLMTELERTSRKL